MTGLDSTLAREQEISIKSKCDVEVCILKKSRDRFRYQPSASLVTHNIHLTCLEGDPVGYLVGQPVGCLVGQPVGYLVGQPVGCFVGLTGLPVGEWEGLAVGILLGDPVGTDEGLDDGDADGPLLGLFEGVLLGLFEGDWLGFEVGCNDEDDVSITKQEE